jgi:hypothetical protein
MRSIPCVSIIALGLLTAACGTNLQERSATGGLTGAGIGALAGGPIGALIGAGAGAAAGAMMPEDATTIAQNALSREHLAAKDLLDRSGLATASDGHTQSGRQATVSGGQATVQQGRAAAASGREVKEAQTRLKDDGLYQGRIDGIVGPQTRRALREYQQREGLQRTARLDDQTKRHLEQNRQEGAGSSAPPAGQVPDNRTNRNQDAPPPNGSDGSGQTKR